jgi:hypothetical protein
LLFTEKILSLEPNDAEALSNKQILTAPAKKTTADPKTKPAPAKKP